MSYSIESTEINVDCAEETGRNGDGPNVSGTTKMLEALLSVVVQKLSIKPNYNENCVTDCTKALELDPTDTKTLILRARALSELGNYALALEDIIAVYCLSASNVVDSMLEESVRNNLVLQNLADFNKNRVFDLPPKIFIDYHIKSFCDDSFNDEFSKSLVQSDVNSGLEMALKCVRDKNYDYVEKACKEELDKTDNGLARSTLTSNLLGTFTLLRGDSYRRN